MFVMNVKLSILLELLDIFIVLNLITRMHSFYKKATFVHYAPVEEPIKGEFLLYAEFKLYGYLIYNPTI